MNRVGDSAGTIQAHHLHLGQGCRIDPDCSIAGIGGPAERVWIGDHVSISEGVRVAAGSVVIGDHVTIHRNTTIYGYGAVSIGPCTWIGQNAVLNCTSDLQVGSGCIISAYSSLWTHFTGGDVLQGCRYDSQRGARLADDVWIGVNAILAPVVVGAKSLVLAGAVVTSDVPENSVWGGNPAVDLTYKLGAPYVETTIEQRFALLCELLRRHNDGANLKAAPIPSPQDCLPGPPDGVFSAGGITVISTGDVDCADAVFDVRDRSYSKCGSPEETAFMRALLYRVKFYPRSEPWPPA